MSSNALIETRRRGVAVAAPRALIGAAGLAAVVGGGAWIALGAAGNSLIVDTAGTDEPAWLRGVLAGLLPGMTDAGFSIALALMLAGYVCAVACHDALRPRWALAGLAAVVVALTLAPPLLSSDIFGYVGYARLGVLHHLNPYVHAPSAAPRDPILPLIFWQEESSPYGPLFTLGSYAIGGRSLPVAIWTVKGVAALAWLASVALVWRAAALLGRPPLRAALILGANPLLLVYALGGGHNDLIAMAPVSGMLALLAAERPAAAGAALIAAAGVKLTGGILLPFVLVHSRDRRRVAAGAAVAAGAIALVAVGVFGTHLLHTVAQIASGGPGGAFNANYSGPDLVGRLLGSGITPAVRVACLAAAAAVVLAGLVRIRAGADWLSAASAGTLAVLAAVAFFEPWYVAWVLPVAALARSRRVAVALVVFTVAVAATHMPMLGLPAYE